jgi:hypothetical protein
VFLEAVVFNHSPKILLRFGARRVDGQKMVNIIRQFYGPDQLSRLKQVNADAGRPSCQPSFFPLQTSQTGEMKHPIMLSPVAFRRYGELTR